MNLDDLNGAVTAAILKAEALQAGGAEALRAFREVAELEERIASIVPATKVAGETARLGAISASLSAAEPLRALELADVFKEDNLSAGVRQRLDELVREAEERLQQTPEPTVEPITVTTMKAA